LGDKESFGGRGKGKRENSIPSLMHARIIRQRPDYYQIQIRDERKARWDVAGANCSAGGLNERSGNIYGLTAVLVVGLVGDGFFFLLVLTAIQALHASKEPANLLYATLYRLSLTSSSTSSLQPRLFNLTHLLHHHHHHHHHISPTHIINHVLLLRPLQRQRRQQQQ
jgi:hypothetical protein